MAEADTKLCADGSSRLNAAGEDLVECCGNEGVPCGTCPSPPPRRSTVTYSGRTPCSGYQNSGHTYWMRTVGNINGTYCVAQTEDPCVWEAAINIPVTVKRYSSEADYLADANATEVPFTITKLVWDGTIGGVYMKTDADVVVAGSGFFDLASSCPFTQTKVYGATSCDDTEGVEPRFVSSSSGSTMVATEGC